MITTDKAAYDRAVAQYGPVWVAARLDYEQRFLARLGAVIHYAPTTSLTACGRDNSSTRYLTDNPGKVTCGKCRRILAAD